jgi:multidrug resistance efflux pump
MPNNNQTHIVSNNDEFKEVLTAPPSWTTKWGTVIIFVVLMQLISITYFVKYPDIVKSNIVLTSNSPTLNIIAKAGGKIKLFVKDNQVIYINHILAYIDNPTNFNDYLSLIKDIEIIKKNIDSYSSFSKEFKVVYYNLGEIQNDYIALIRSIKSYETYLNVSSTEVSIRESEKQIYLYSSLNQLFEKQISIVGEELKIAESKYRMDSILYYEKVISELDFNSSKSSLLPINRNQQNYLQSIMTNTIRIEEIKSKISDLKIQREEKIAELKNNIRNNLNLLEANLLIWEQKYLFKSPIEGKISLFKFWSDNQNVNIGETLFAIVPKANEVFGQLQLPMAKSGKVKLGQEVNIKFNNYPFDEFGIVKGNITSISLVSQGGMYSVKVSLKNGLNTSYNQQLEFKDQMDGTAEIVTADLRLIERIFSNFLKLIK